MQMAAPASARQVADHVGTDDMDELSAQLVRLVVAGRVGATDASWHSTQAGPELRFSPIAAK